MALFPAVFSFCKRVRSSSHQLLCKSVGTSYAHTEPPAQCNEMKDPLLPLTFISLHLAHSKSRASSNTQRNSLLCGCMQVVPRVKRRAEKAEGPYRIGRRDFFRSTHHVCSSSLMQSVPLDFLQCQVRGPGTRQYRLVLLLFGAIYEIYSYCYRHSGDFFW